MSREFYSYRCICFCEDLFNLRVFDFVLLQLKNMSTQVEIREEDSFKQALADVRSDESPTNW